VVSECGEKAEVALNKQEHSITIEKGNLYAKEGNSPVYGLLVPIGAYAYRI